MTGTPEANSFPARSPGDHHGSPRTKRRLMVHHGTDQADRTAFTGNVSERGLFLRTGKALAPDEIRPGRKILIPLSS